MIRGKVNRLRENKFLNGIEDRHIKAMKNQKKKNDHKEKSIMIKHFTARNWKKSTFNRFGRVV